MTERQLQFRVGIFVLAAMTIAGVMVFQFGELRAIWERHYTVAIHFDTAPGVQPSTPVRRNGITIGRVREVVFDEEQGGVIVWIDVRAKYRLRRDAQPRLVRSLLGDASIALSPGRSRQYLPAGGKLHGKPPVDPIEIIGRLEGKMTNTLEAFHATSREWQHVGRNLNALMETNHGQLGVVIERTAEALNQFTLTMRNANTALVHANKVLGDPQQQENLKRTLTALPDLVDETRQTILAVRLAAHSAGQNLSNLNEVTLPLAKRSRSMVAKLDSTLGNLQTVSAELSQFSRLLRKEDGSLQKFMADPELYRNLNRSASSLAILLKNIEPIVGDLRIFSDKIARHPELIGVRGAFSGSSGLKEPPREASRNGIPPDGDRLRRQ